MKKLKSIQGIPIEYIQSILKIDPDSPSGLTWLPRTDVPKDWNAKFANNHAGHIHKDAKTGYQRWGISIAYNGKYLRLICSRIIFFLHHGYLTKGKCIDHKDNNALNNKIENLRESTDFENAHNSKLRKNNTSGHKGVNWDKGSKKWKVQILANGKYHYFGIYVNKEDAIKVAIAARKKLHGDFGRIQ